MIDDEHTMFPTEYQEPTYNTAIQVVQMLRLLEERPDGRMRVAELAERLDVHPRTIKRYIEAIGSVITSADNKPYIERVRDGRTPYAKVNRSPSQALSITLYEYAALRLATVSMSASMPDTFGLLHETASEKVAEIISEDVAKELKNFEDAFVYVPYGPKQYDRHSDLVIRKAIDAVVKRHPSMITYRSGASSDAVERNIEPHSIVLYRDALYVYARQTKPRLSGNTFRYFAVDRIGDFNVQRNKTFKQARTYEASELGQHSLGIWETGEPQRVQLRFYGPGAQYVQERHWPNQHSLERVDDNEVRLEMDIPITPEVVTWLAGWGRYVEVVAPEVLIDKIRDHHADALDYYV